ncbi:MAG: RNA polymerase sigma factor [Gemmatimonadota bacterium]|nr:MAG: RNA polymerase sigma factor [Gemmatimonadota bacterium]
MTYTRVMQTHEQALAGEPSAAPVEVSRLRVPDLPQDFAQWHRDHRAAVYRYVRFRVATRETAEDVTSDVFLKALRSIKRYDSNRAAPRTWLLRIARNAITDHLRSLRRRGSLHVSLDRIPDLVAQVASQEERVLKEERIQHLLNGTKLLRKADQDVLSLRYGSGLDNNEIAEALGVSPNAVAVRLHRALKRLKGIIDKSAAGDGR